MFLALLKSNLWLTIDRQPMDGTRENIITIFKSNARAMKVDFFDTGAVVMHYVRSMDTLFVTIKDTDRIIRFDSATGQFNV